jgi:uncharacterized protein DUF4160
MASFEPPNSRGRWGRRPRRSWGSGYAGTRAAVDLDGGVIAGEIDGTALRHVQEWTRVHREELLANWDRARRAEPILQIQPLT